MTDGEPILIRTKLAPPRIGHAPVGRDRLLDLLDARPDHRLCLVQGPAGSGKTMLLTQLRQRLIQNGAHVAWYNAASDDDDMQIVSYVFESLRDAGVVMEREGLQTYLRSGGKAVKALLASLVNDVGGYDKPVVLVIDDFHSIPSFGIFALVDRWIALAPPNFRLVLGSRTRPPLDLAELRARDQLTEVSFEALRFDVAETRRFLEARGVERLDAAQVNALHDITDGWAAGLQLLTFSLRQETAEAFFAREAELSLSQEHAMREYLERTVIRQLSSEDLEFLTRVSTCRRFNRELSELLTGDDEAGERLARFEAENLFLLPIDTLDAEPWYRFHRLFAGFLNHRLQSAGEKAVRELHQRAAGWFAAHDLPLEALRHARNASDVEMQIDLLTRGAREMINAAQFLQLLRLCEGLPPQRVAERLDLNLCIAWAQLSCGRLAAFEATIADVERHPLAAAHDRIFEVQLLKAYHALQQDDTSAQLRLVEPMLDQAPPANAFHALLMYTIAGIGQVYANRFESAREIVRRRYQQAEAARTRRKVSPFLDMLQGLSHLVQGHVQLAADHLLPVFDATRLATRMGPDAMGLLIGYVIAACYELDDVERARQLLDPYSELVEAIGNADALLCTLRVRARIEMLDGETAAAQRTILKLEEMGVRLHLDRLVAWSLHDQLVLLSPGRGGATPERLQRLGALATRYRGRDGSLGEIPLAATIATAQFAPIDQRVEAIESARLMCAEQGRRLLVVRMGLLGAVALAERGDRVAAEIAAAGPIAEAQELGMRRLLAEFEPALKSLSSGALVTTPAMPGTAGPLSPRERDVIELLGRALSVKSIARELDLSAGTVKWHLKNVYGKLDAVSREDALAKARTLGILR